MNISNIGSKTPQEIADLQKTLDLSKNISRFSKDKNDKLNEIKSKISSIKDNILPEMEAADKKPFKCSLEKINILVPKKMSWIESIIFPKQAELRRNIHTNLNELRSQLESYDDQLKLVFPDVSYSIPETMPYKDFNNKLSLLSKDDEKKAINELDDKTRNKFLGFFMKIPSSVSQKDLDTIYKLAINKYPDELIILENAASKSTNALMNELWNIEFPKATTLLPESLGFDDFMKKISVLTESEADINKLNDDKKNTFLEFFMNISSSASEEDLAELYNITSQNPSDYLDKLEDGSTKGYIKLMKKFLEQSIPELQDILPQNGIEFNDFMKKFSVLKRNEYTLNSNENKQILSEFLMISPSSASEKDLATLYKLVEAKSPDDLSRLKKAALEDTNQLMSELWSIEFPQQTTVLPEGMRFDDFMKKISVLTAFEADINKLNEDEKNTFLEFFMSIYSDKENLYYAIISLLSTESTSQRFMDSINNISEKTAKDLSRLNDKQIDLATTLIGSGISPNKACELIFDRQKQLIEEDDIILDFNLLKESYVKKDIETFVFKKESIASLKINDTPHALDEKEPLTTASLQTALESLSLTKGQLPWVLLTLSENNTQDFGIITKALQGLNQESDLPALKLDYTIINKKDNRDIEVIIESQKDYPYECYMKMTITEAGNPSISDFRVEKRQVEVN